MWATTVLRSSIAGRVGDRGVRVGQFVQPGARLMSIVPVSDVYLVANFKETQIARMKIGQHAAVKIDALGGKDIDAVVDSFSPGTGAQFALLPPENATGNFTKIVQRVPVRIRLQPPADLRDHLLPGSLGGREDRHHSGSTEPESGGRSPVSMTATAGAAPAQESASLQDWIAVIAGALGALIASLDISIVNSALPTIQGEIGASGTEGTWIATGYLVSEVVMIPLSAWLTRVFGLRTLLLLCAGLFTLFSMVCGAAHDLPTMILGRVGQGFFGGALIPTAQTIVRTRLPPRQMPIGMTIFGLIVLLGPLVGPLLGGWLTENANWRWCFYLNIPISIGLGALLILGLPHQKSHMDQVVNADWLGIVGMTAGLELPDRRAWRRASATAGSSRRPSAC